VRGHRSVGILSLLRQAISLGADFGARSVESLLSVAEMVEQSVVEPGSLRRTPDGLSLALDNPPLRVGAFSKVRILVDGEAIPSERVSLRTGEGTPWRTAATVTPGWTFDLGPGDRTEIRIVTSAGGRAGPVRVRVELVPLAIPPLVWVEVRETPSEPPGAP